MRSGFFFATVIFLTLLGCQERQAAPVKQSQQARMRRADRGEALLNAAANQLADLPAAVDTELRPPTVILDSTKSANGQDVLAVCISNPSVPDGPVNYVSVPSQNSLFRSRGVRSGDVLKYYLREDETVDEERRQFGFTRQMAIELTVAQVIDDSTLLIDGGLNQQVLIPTKIEIWRYLDDRLVEINDKLLLFAERRLPPVGWQPSPDEHVLAQIVAWLNQWLRQSGPKTDWRRDPMLETLDRALLTEQQLAPFLAAASLSAEKFLPYEELQPQEERTMRNSLYDGRLLQEAVWLRDISRWAQGDEFNDVARATALFDWTVRNVQLEADENAAPHRPWQVLLYGRGTAEQRAWVFTMLCRQQGLDVMMLGLSTSGQPNKASEATANEPKRWLPTLLLDGQLYLFDTRLGLPIPGPAGVGVATLAQVQTDDSLLRQLDLEDAPYPVTADSLKSIVACVVADPFDLTRRARQLESKLTGDDHLRLTTVPSELAAQLKSVPGVADVRLWEVPFRTLRDQLTLGKAARPREALEFEPFAMRPVLWKARTRHFQGRRQVEDEPQDEMIDDHREAARLYTSKSVRPPDREIAQSTSAGERRVVTTAKMDATLWLGLLSFDDGKYEVAEHWFSRPELGAADSPWAAAARYNLARVFEAQDKLEDAVKLLQEDTSPQRHGNRLRARQLTKKIDESKQE